MPDTTYPVVDLFAAETGAVLAWTQYLVGERLAALLPVVVDRLEREVRGRVLGPYREIDDWWWLGKTHGGMVNNWNPWIHSNILAANLLLERDQATRNAVVVRAIEGIDRFMAGYHSDGGCDEGTSYWGHAGGSLFDCLDLIASASDGRLDAFGVPLVREIGRYIYRAHIADNWYVNFADGAARVAINAPLVYGYGRRIGDRALMAQGAAATRIETRGEWRGGEFERILRALHAPVPEAERGCGDAAGARGVARRHSGADGAGAGGGGDGAVFLAAKGGHNAESHNHNDIGSFIVALDGRPVVIDVGVGVYTRQTFSADRYSIWTMQSGYHNLPVINGYEQRDGREFAAREVVATLGEDAAELELDIAWAYPREAWVYHCERTLRLERGDTPRIVLHDAFYLAAPPTSLALHLMLADEADVVTPGEIRCATPTRPLIINYDPKLFTVAVERIAIDDARLAPVWGERVYRLVLTAQEGKTHGDWWVTFTAG
ncbi:MAG: heparinase II/III family protein [Chloroflexia bacterium]